MIYNLIYAGSSLLTMLMYSSKRNVNAFLYTLVFIFLFVFSAIRFEVGCDYYSYYNHAIRFETAHMSDALAMSEPGYWATVIILKKLGLEFPAINVVAAVMFFFGVHRIARRQPNPLMYLTLLFPILITGIPMSAVRQAMAMGLIALAFNAFADRKLISFLVWVVFAGLFHKSAYLFIAAAPAIYKRGDRSRGLAGLLLTIPVLYLASKSDVVEQYSTVYVGTDIDAAGAVFRVAYVALTGAVLLVFYRKQWKFSCPNDYELVFYFSIVALAILPLTLYSSVAGDRYGYYVMLVTCAIQARLYLITSSSLRPAMFMAPFIIAGVQLFGWTMLSGIFQTCYGEYKTWWS